jgi:hypothetical protein
MNLKDIAKQLLGLGLPVLGAAVGGPGGAAVAKGIAAAIGLTDAATPEQTAAALGNLNGDQLVALRKLESEVRLAEIDAQRERDRGQVELIKGDQQKSLFDRGWRPGAAWICVFGLAYTFGLRPLLPWTLQVLGVQGVPALPAIDMMELFVMLGGLLGLGGMRHRERLNGKA